MTNNELTVKISKKVFNEPFLKYLNNDKRYLVFYGGAGSGKSYFAAERFVYKMLNSKKFNLLVVRNTGKSNRDSTFALMKQVIKRWKLYKYFKINESDLRIRCSLNGHEIVFAGLDDVEKLKSITFTNGELTDIWIEEASEIQYQDFTQLDIRLRGIGIKHQFTITFNPIDINHWLKKHFFDKSNDQVEIFHSTYKTNAFLDDNYKGLLESYKESDPYYYEVYCLGHWGVLGKTIFDARAVQDRLQSIQKPVRTGEFTYDYDGNKITNIRWRNDSNGYIKMYDVPNRYAYAIGGDTSGEGSDWFTGHVVNAETGKQVAVLRHQFDADIYARQMYCLGIYYNNALIGIESNFDSYPIKELFRLGYSNQYIREKEDTYTGSIDKSYGFRTTAITRPVIISELVKIVRDETGLINDKGTLEEMLTFVRNEKGRAEAQDGAHDDNIMGLAIAYRVREQVVVRSEQINIMQKFNFKAENKQTIDYGEQIKPI